MRRIIPAAELGISLCEQGEKLTVIDHFEEENLLDGNVVIMKGSRNLERIKMATTGRESYEVYNLGLENGWVDWSLKESCRYHILEP